MTLTDRVEFIRSVFGQIYPDRNFKNISVQCPNCLRKDNKKKIKLAIRSDNFQYHCWRCSVKGRSLIPLLKKYFPQHLAEYISKFDKNYKEDDVAEIVSEAVCLPSDFLLLGPFLHDLPHRENTKEAIRYLFKRGLREREIWFFKLGISQIVEFANRIVVPSFDDEGVLNYWTARRMTGGKYGKYHNPDIPRHNVIFNDINIDWKKPILLVEGPFDLFKCPDNTIPILGSELDETFKVFEKILIHQPKVLLGLDSDKKRAALKIAKSLDSYSIDVSIVDWGPKDPGELLKSEVLNKIENSKEWTPEMDLITRISSIFD